MHTRYNWLLITIVLAWHALACAQTCMYKDAGLGLYGPLHGVVAFPPDDPIKLDIRTLPVDPNSTKQICTVDGQPPCGTILWPHPSFGSNDVSAGIRYYVVDSRTQPMVPVTIGAYARESDPDGGTTWAPMPPDAAAIEGGGKPGDDNHALIIDRHGCWAYEFYHASYKGGAWSADQVSIWDLTNNEQRPYGWTSTDAAGLPIFPILVKYEEAHSGVINHALRCEFANSRNAAVLPAHHYTMNTATGWPQMGARWRLKSSFDTTLGGKAAIEVKAILDALKKYGCIMADNGGGGSGWMVDGTSDKRWNDTQLHDQLAGVKLNNFEFITNNPDGSPMTSYGPQGTIANWPTGSAPKISHFTASPASIAAGESTTLTWTASAGSSAIITPDIGPVRGTSITVSPNASKTYTLYLTNQYGRTTAHTKVKVR